MKSLLPSIVTSLALGYVTADAAVIVADYTFVPSGNGASSDADPDTTATSFVKGSFTGGTAADASIDTSLRVGGTATASADLAGALANNAYFSFTLQIGAGSLSLSSLNFDQRYATNGSAAGSHGFSVLSSVGGFDAANSLFNYTVANLNNTSYAPASVDLSGAAFQNLTGDVEFRFYFYDSSGANERAHRINNIVLSAVPEPSSALLGSIAATGLLIRRRR